MSSSESEGAARRRREPWPIALALALLGMIGACIAFFAIAVSNPDPPLDLERAGLRPYEGYVAPRAQPGEPRSRPGGPRR
jgi:hypothetical protein